VIRLTVKFEMGDFRRWCDAKARGLARWSSGPIQGGRAALQALEAHHAALFDSHGAAGLGGRSSGYGAWAPLALRTLRARAGRVRCSRIAPRDYAGPMRGDRTLAWSWRLRDSLATQGNRFGDAVRQIRATGLTYGTGTPTALFHAAGRGGRNPMPVRMPLDDIVGPQVALDAIEGRIMSFLEADGEAPPSPGLVPNAAGFYSRP
jgi:hypothetical protein